MTELYGVYTVDCEGKVLAYTGKAGEQWLSENLGEMFIGYSKEGAQYKCECLMKTRPSMKFFVHDRNA